MFLHVSVILFIGGRAEGEVCPLRRGSAFAEEAGGGLHI